MAKTERVIGIGGRAILVIASLVALAVFGATLCRVCTSLLREVTSWFDPLFFLYNLVLALLAVLIIPLITYLYTRNMKDEKVRRIERDLLPQELERYRKDIERLVPQQFGLAHYWGSMGVVMLVIASGAVIILLLKPYFPLTDETPAPPPAASVPAGTHDAGAAPSAVNAQARKDPAGLGVDYGKGANMLLLGPFVELYSTNRRTYYHQIVISLTAFQFGFLGAYIYFIGYFLRAYFTLDLSTHTLVAGSIRMVTSSVLALVLSYALPGLGVFGSLSNAAESERFLRFLPFLAFFLGYFPNRALFLLDKLGNRLLGLGSTTYAGTPLACLAGMSSDHEARLDREGFDNLENLSHARAIDLAVRTGFSYRQLRQWIGEARLRLHLGADFDEFADRTGIRTAEELLTYCQGQADAAALHLKEIVSPRTFGKLMVVIPLLLREQADRSSVTPVDSIAS